MCPIFSNRKQSRLSSFIDLRFCASIAFLLIREEFITLNTTSVVNELRGLQICHNSNYCNTNSLCQIRRLYSLSVANFTFLLQQVSSYSHQIASSRKFSHGLHVLVLRSAKYSCTFYYDTFISEPKSKWHKSEHTECFWYWLYDAFSYKTACTLMT